MDSHDAPTAIAVNKLYKSFVLPHEKHSGIKQAVINILGGRAQGKAEKQKVLKDVSFEIKKGEFFGIVGRNGSGKSTLLKLLAEIYTPDAGSIQVNGSLTPFIELGVGFNHELTGRENVFLNGALLGFDRKEMEAMYDEIVEFSELGKFMDQKLKNYSSGMQVRLAFSIAIRANSDILLLDEVLAVGDAEFQQKCFAYFEQLKKAHKTIILVTHDMSAVRRFCNRALLIEKGKIKAIGSPHEIASQYTLDNMNAEKKNAQDESNGLGSHIKKLEIRPVSKTILSKDEDFVFDIHYQLAIDSPVVLGISLLHENHSIIEHNTKKIELPYGKQKKHVIRYRLPLHQFNPGRFEVTTAVFKKAGFQLIGFDAKGCSFVIDDNGRVRGGLLNNTGHWEIL